MDDNIFRFNDDFEEEIGKPINAETIITFNEWGDHPITIEANAIYPIKDFMDWNFGMDVYDLLGNSRLIDELFGDEEWVKEFIKRNIKAKYHKDSDTLVCRSTKFTKPTNRTNENSRRKILNSIIRDLKGSNMNGLAISMGYRHIGENDPNMLSYDIRDFNNEYTREDFEKKGFTPYKINFSWDIDTRKGAKLTLTPAILYWKKQFSINNMEIANKNIYKILIDEQIEIPTTGSGKYGEKNDLYVNMICKVMEKYYSKLKIKPKKVSYSVDDKRKWFLNEVRKKRIAWINGYRTFRQHGEDGIIQRQQMTKIGFDNKIVYNHPKNKQLENDIRNCQRAEISNEKRKTSGLTNYLDRIDSMENGIIEYKNIIWQSNKKRKI